MGMTLVYKKKNADGFQIFFVGPLFRWQNLLKRYRQPFGFSLKNTSKSEQVPVLLKGIGRPLKSYKIVQYFQNKFPSLYNGLPKA